MNRVLAVSVIGLALLAGGCHDPNYEDDDYDDGYYVNRTPYVRDFTLIPAPGARAVANGALPITPHLGDGNFELRWELDGYGPIHVDLYVSNDRWLGPEDPYGRDDLLFKHLWSGDNLYTDEYHIDTTYLGCRFTTDNILSCGAITYDNPGRDLTPFLNQLPKTGYLILRACDGNTQDCDTRSLYVEFQ